MHDLQTIIKLNAPGYKHSVEIKESTVMLNKTVKCVSCEEETEGGEYWATRGEYEQYPLCENCEGDDLSEPIATAKRGDDTYLCGTYVDSVYGEDDAIQEYFDSIRWHSTDAWRGYYMGSAPTDYKQMMNSWFCPMDGTNLDEEFYQKYEDGEFDGLDFFIAFPRTSNVFSSGIEVYVDYDSVDEFKNILSGHTDEA